MKKGLKQKDNICIICNKDIGTVMAARASHMRKHVRDGSLIESRDESEKLIWEATGKEPQDDKICWKSHWKPKTNVVRIPTRAKSDKSNKISICCKMCNKWSKSIKNFADDRFVSISCCDGITVFPKRLIDTLIRNPGKEYIE